MVDPVSAGALAEQDLDETWSYVDQDANPTTADRFMDAIVDRFESLANNLGWVAWVGARRHPESFSAARPSDGLFLPVAIELRTAYRTGSEAAL